MPTDYRAFLASHDFRYSKTMPQWPHEYIVRSHIKDLETFDAFCELIEREGYDQMWFKKKRRYLDVDGYKYWVMDSYTPGDKILNRARLAKYDIVAESYDSLFDHEEDKAIERELLGIIAPLIKGNVLDLGCGTGFLLDNVNIAPNKYTGIDMSWKMLRELKQKHPAHRDCVKETLAEYWYKSNYTKYDTVVSLFGSCSYFDEPLIAKMKDFVLPGGNLILMFYGETYNPVTYERSGATFTHHKWSEERLERLIGPVRRFHDYYLITV